MSKLQYVPIWTHQGISTVILFCWRQKAERDVDKKLHSFIFCSKMLHIFYKFVVKSAISYGVTCWGRIRSSYLERLKKRIKKAATVLGSALELPVQKGMFVWMENIIINIEHHLHYTTGCPVFRSPVRVQVSYTTSNEDYPRHWAEIQFKKNISWRNVLSFYMTKGLWISLQAWTFSLKPPKSRKYWITDLNFKDIIFQRSILVHQPNADSCCWCSTALQQLWQYIFIWEQSVFWMWLEF